MANDATPTPAGNLPTPEQVVTLAGKTFSVAPLSFEGWHDFARWAAERYSKAVWQHLGELEKHLPAKAIEGIVDRTLARAVTMSPTDPVVQAATRQLEGAAYLLWLATRQTQPELSAEEIGDLLAKDGELRPADAASDAAAAPAVSMTATKGK
jgi:hypothetical protein